MNFTFIPSPEKAKEFTAVEDACERISPLKLRNGDSPHFQTYFHGKITEITEKWGQSPISQICAIDFSHS